MSMLIEMLGKGNVVAGFGRHPKRGQIAHGHFDRSVGKGVEDMQAADSQFVTILREPFERVVSWYFHLKNRHGGEGHWHGGTIRVADYGRNVREFVMNYPADTLRFLPPWDYLQALERFALVMITERLWDGARALAHYLGKPRPAMRGGNPSVKDEPIPLKLKPQFRAMHPCEYDFYEHAKETWAPIWNQFRK